MPAEMLSAFVLYNMKFSGTYIRQTRVHTDSLRLGRFRERKYQLNAQRRNEASTRLEHYREVAKYFERECGKADQFNAWNVQEAKVSRCPEARRRGDSLESRREKLRSLLSAEKREYARECDQLDRRQGPRVDFSSSGFRDRLKENRAEASLYKPTACRRIQSYLYGAYDTRKDSRPALREFNGHVIDGDSSRMNIDKTKAREENGEASDEGIADNRESAEQEGYNKRMAEYKENSRSARASNLYGDEPEAVRLTRSAGSYRPAAGLSTDSNEHRPHTRRLHDSHFLVGNQLHLQEEGGTHKEPNQRFSDRYANRSLEATNVGETAAHSMEEAETRENGEADDEIADEGTDESDQANVLLKKMSINDDENDRHDDDRKDQDGDDSSMRDNASQSSREQQEANEAASELERNEQHDIDVEVGAKASAGRSDHRHFECQKSLPWMRMIPGEKNLSEQMFLYLTHNELKGQIQDLEKRENQAATKHQWDEALRLRDMRNRLDLARERNLYRREDLLLDPAVKKLGMASIEARSKLLKEREILCTNSSMYSEEAKAMWSQWLVEDEKTVSEDARLQREDLMKQLEETWRSLAVDDKQRISDSFNKDIIEAVINQDNENSYGHRSANH